MYDRDYTWQTVPGHGQEEVDRFVSFQPEYAYIDQQLEPGKRLQFPHGKKAGQSREDKGVQQAVSRQCDRGIQEADIQRN